MHPIVERLLEKRNIQDREAFLSPSYDTRPDPFLLKGMDVAVERILLAISNKEHIAVWHDYDCDGIPGGALMHDFFKGIGYPLRTYVAERSEGYGLNEGGIRALSTEGVSLIITVDCGITDTEEVLLAKSLGIDVIVTDHHLPQEQVPQAFAVINAHQKDDAYPYKGLCGTGVAFKLVEALIQKGNFSLPTGWEKWLLDLVALATIADMVPLTGENRTLVRYGFLVLKKGRREGLRALFEIEKVPLQHITEDDISFSVAPKINAASRMASPKLAFELLTTPNAERARFLAKELVKLNKERKLEGMRVAKEVKHKIEALPHLGEVIVMGSSTWRPSLLGIAATNVVETYNKTVFLWGKDGEIIKGSCRSNGMINMVTLMSGAKEAFVDFGGHELSGGFSLTEEGVHTLPGMLQSVFESLPASEPLEKRNVHDEVIRLEDMTDSAYDALRSMAPFGQENAKPIFRIENVRVQKMFRFGGGNEHVRMTLEDNYHTLEAISFFISRMPFRDTLELLSPNDLVSIEGSLERSHFRGKKELRLRIESLSLAL